VCACVRENFLREREREREREERRQRETERDRERLCRWNRTTSWNC